MMGLASANEHFGGNRRVYLLEKSEDGQRFNPAAVFSTHEKAEADAENQGGHFRITPLWFDPKALSGEIVLKKDS